MIIIFQNHSLVTLYVCYLEMLPEVVAAAAVEVAAASA
jgi:hypothetical protein